MKWFLFGLGTLVAFTANGDDFSDELPRIPPTEAVDTIANFSVASGFRIELVASEPLIGSPVAIEWDAKGRMFVCEMRGYSENQDDKVSTIGMLEDVDGDGVYDRRHDFVDGLRWPTAIFPYDDGLFVGDAPDLYYFKDTDGDGRADLKKTVLTGFGTSNVQGLMNSFRWGLDNRIHIACSSVGGKIRRPDQPESDGINVRGRDIALDPRDGTFVPTSGAAQHGMCFDDWGRKFVSSNSNHIQQVMYEDRHISRNRFFSPPPSRISIAADGPQAEVYRTSPVEPWRIVRTRLRVAGAVPGPVEGGGRAAGYFTGATGVTIYRGDAWADQWKGLAIIGDVGSNLIHRKRLKKSGLPFLARRIDNYSEFVTSKDIWFRPAQFASAPDGSLHVIDVCREVIEHPKSLPPDIKKHLDLTAGRDRGRIYRVVPTEFRHRVTPDLSNSDSSALVAMLEHPNAWHREAASRLLFEKQDSGVVDALIQLASRSESPLGRMHALYVLEGLGSLDSDTLAARFFDPHPQVRRHAILLMEKCGIGETAYERLEQLATDESIDVRYQLAFSIGSMEHPRRVNILAELIRHDVGDRWMRAAVQSSLAEDAAKLMTELATDQSFRSSAAGVFLSSLSAQISLQNREDDIAIVISALESLPTEDAVFALPIIGDFLEGRSRKGSVLAKMSGTESMQRLEHTVDKMVASMADRATDVETADGSRVDAIEALSFGRFENVNTKLLGLIDHRNSHEVQRAAITTLGRFPNAEVAKPLITAWKTLSPRLRETASEAIFSRADRTLALFDAIDSGELPTSSLTPARLQMAAKSKNDEVRRRTLLFQSSLQVGPRKDVVASYQEALKIPGDVERGRGVFKKHCSTCHRVEGVGFEVGPNLATIKTRGPETILVNVLDPSREVNPEYLNYVALTLDGRSVTGMIAAENASSVTLRRAENASDNLLRVDLDRLQSTGQSIMPEGLEKSIDVQAMADIIAYLMQAK